MQNSFPTRAPWWLTPLCALIVLFLVAPTLVVIPMSFSDSRFLTFPPASWSLRWYLEYFQSLEWREATWVSLRAAVGTTALATPLGLAAAYAAARVTAGHARWLRLVFLLPLALPVILCGVGVFLLYARLGLNNTLLGLVLAHTCLALPLVFITVSAALASFDFSQEMAARSLGAHPLRAFRDVTLPQIRFSVMAAAILAFITSLDEVVVALFIAGGPSATLTKRMFNSLRDEVDPAIAAISTLLILVSVALPLAARALQRRR
ncbi:ABC transporter permease [Achromobacter denitrificans]|uniref:ABC transporter permease n=1 Tax=Achromobacter denitrificans TaxID=32002 RepID=A0A6N0JR59_ACHDE|nr:MULTISPECIES: ABC transporter permease [Achromobacter]MBV2160855.1 ABC transporter permease [Achromobacter denitrificans]MDF3860185.1 ABC transporter permease [Achromobacter denitrificans]MDX3877940.1 ABC transporter permease [Achromobacter sp.]MPT37674.1 ABC transporter permease [Achromobacter sp.]QCS61816.1 ABC transporter permease [Achromobacter denitrificans]